MSPTVPAGSFTAIPVGMSALPPTLIVTSAAAYKSKPASLSWARVGSWASGASFFIRNCKSFSLSVFAVAFGFVPAVCSAYSFPAGWVAVRQTAVYEVVADHVAGGMLWSGGQW